MAQKKTKKDLELEAQKLLEEQKQKEDEERRLKQEQEEKYQVKQIETGLFCVLTQYYVTECLKVQNPLQFTEEFIKRWFTEKNILINFKPVDFKILGEFITNNLKFANFDLHLNPTSTMILLNIFFQLFRENDKKYLVFPKNEEWDATTYEQKRNEEVRKGKKNMQQEFVQFKDLLLAHSIDNPDKKQKKYFSSDQLKSIIEYAKTGYFAHFNLYDYVMRKEQRIIETFQSIVIDEPNFEPNLDQAMFMKNEEQSEKERKVVQESALDQQEQQEKKQVEEEEEDLDPISMQILRDNIREAEEQMLKQLEEREQQLELKLEEAFATKVKKGK